MRFQWDTKRILITIVAAFVGISAVEFTLGTALIDVLKSSAVAKVTGIPDLLSFILGISIIFGFMFYLLESKFEKRFDFKEGLKLGLFYGVIAAVPTAMIGYFLTSQATTYTTAALLISLIDYIVAGGLTGFALSKIK